MYEPLSKRLRIVNSGAVSASAPLVASGNHVSLPQVNATTDGYLSAADWVTFNAHTSAPVTNAHLAPMVGPSIKGVATTGSAQPQDLSPSTVTGMLVPYAGGSQGLVPAAGLADTFLAVNGTWAAPPSSGGTVSNVSAIGNNGVSVAVANPTSTPQLTIGLGAIIPTSVAAVGTINGSNVVGVAVNSGDQTVQLTGNITSGVTSGPSMMVNTTISPGVITNAMLVNMSSNSIKGNNTASLGPATDLTPADTAAMLPAYAGGASKGLVPTAGAPNTFLAVNGTWAPVGSSNITNNSIGNQKLAQMASLTIKGNNTLGLADAQDLTTTQVTALLDPYAGVGKGLVPAPGPANTFLAVDGNWLPALAGPNTAPSQYMQAFYKLTSSTNVPGALTNMAFSSFIGTGWVPTPPVLPATGFSSFRCTAGGTFLVIWKVTVSSSVLSIVTLRVLMGPTVSDVTGTGILNTVPGSETFSTVTVASTQVVTSFVVTVPPGDYIGLQTVRSPLSSAQFVGGLGENDLASQVSITRVL